MGTIRTQLQTDIYRNAVMYAFLGNHDRVKDWYDAGDMAVVLIEHDGCKTYYDDTVQTMRVLRDIDDIDEERFAFEFSRRLARELRLTNLNQKSFAKELGISEHTMSNYMTGKTIPDAYTAFRMTQLFGCKMNELFYLD